MTTAADNHRRWDGSSRGHYEVWYLTCNDPQTGDGYWIRYTLEAPQAGVGEPYAQIWFARFDAGTDGPARTFGINRKLPIASLTAATEPFEIALGGSRLGNDHATGAVSGDGHAAEWDLRWTPATRTLHQLPAVMYRRGGLGETTVLSPNVDVALSGSITVDGTRFLLAGAPGGQTHLWGKKHAHAWGWGHCNAFEGHPGAVLEVLAPRLKRGGFMLPPMTVCTLRVGGEELAFTRFDQALRAPRAELATGRFRFAAGGLTARLEGEFSCRPEDLVRAEYHDPDGEPSYCHNSCVADLRVTVYRRAGTRWREDVRLVAPRRGHFEIAGRTPDPAVTNRHVTVG